MNGDLDTFDERSFSNSNKNKIEEQSDYDLNHKDLVMIKKFEKHLKLFDIFKVRNPEMVVLILAGAKTIANEAGRFTLKEAYKYLGYMSKKNREKVFKELLDKGWIIFDGFDYEMPGKARTLLSSMFLAFAKDNLTMAEQIRTTVILTGFVDDFNMDIEETVSIKDLGFRELFVWRDYLERVIQKKSRREILAIGKDTEDIVKSIKDAQDILSNNCKIFGREKYNEFFDITSSILDLITKILGLAIQYQRESQKALGEYISIEMVEKSFSETTIEVLANLIEKNFSAPKQVYQFREEIIDSRTRSFFENKKDKIKYAIPPEPVGVIEEEMIIDTVENLMELFYQEVVIKMDSKDEAPMDEILYKDIESFGEAMYKTGQLLKLTNELKKDKFLENSEKELFSIIVNDDYKKLTQGPVEMVTECYLRRYNNGKDE